MGGLPGDGANESGCSLIVVWNIINSQLDGKRAQHGICVALLHGMAWKGSRALEPWSPELWRAPYCTERARGHQGHMQAVLKRSATARRRCRPDARTTLAPLFGGESSGLVPKTLASGRGGFAKRGSMRATTHAEIDHQLTTDGQILSITRRELIREPAPTGLTRSFAHSLTRFTPSCRQCFNFRSWVLSATNRDSPGTHIK